MSVEATPKPVTDDELPAEEPLYDATLEEGAIDTV